MIKYRGDTFVIGKKFIINEKEYRFTRRNNSNLIFESVADKSKLAIKESDFNKMLIEKINKDNQEINDIIGKVLRSKGLARKYEDKLKDLGISIDYDNPQGVTLTGANGRKLSANSKEVYGPHTPDSSGERYDKDGYRRRPDGHYKSNDSRDIWYANKADEEKTKLDNLKSMDRDDIIRKYNDLSTDEALQKHKEDITKTEENIAKYTKDAKREDERYQQSLNSAKDKRRDAAYSGLRTSTPKNKADSAVDYLNYLTKPDNEYMENIRQHYKRHSGEEVKSDPSANHLSGESPDITKYRDLKKSINYAKDDVELRTVGSGRRYTYDSAAMTDEQLEAKIKSMRDDLEKQIEELRKSNKANTEERDSYVKRLEDREKELDDFLKSKGIRKESQKHARKGITLTELAEFRARRK